MKTFLAVACLVLIVLQAVTIGHLDQVGRRVDDLEMVFLVQKMTNPTCHFGIDDVEQIRRFIGQAGVEELERGRRSWFADFRKQLLR